MKKILLIFFLLGVLSCEKEDDDDYGNDSSYIASIESEVFKNG